MRYVRIMNPEHKIIGGYEVKDIQSAFEDITGNGYIAIDIKFDFNGDIVILVTDAYASDIG